LFFLYPERSEGTLLSSESLALDHIAAKDRVWGHSETLAQTGSLSSREKPLIHMGDQLLNP
jgi:hypothetical protein